MNAEKLDPKKSSADESEIKEAYKVPSFYVDRIYFTDISGILGRFTFSEGRLTSDNQVEPNHRVAITMTITNMIAMRDLLNMIVSKVSSNEAPRLSPAASLKKNKK